MKTAPFAISVTGAHVNDTIDCLYRSLFYTSTNQSLRAFFHYRLRRHMNGKCYNQINGDHSVETVLLHHNICRLRNTPRKK